jgi:hypothetical protein
MQTSMNTMNPMAKSKRGGWRPGAGRPRKILPGEENSLQIHKIREIIDLCQAKGVSKLKLNGVELEFFQRDNSISSSPMSVKERQMDVADQEAFEEMALTQQMIDDPSSFEQHIIDSHLEKYRGNHA